MQEFLASTNFTTIFISLVAVKFLLETYLKLRNLKSIELNKNAIPERFVSVVTKEEYRKSIDYNVDRIRFQIFTALFGAAVLIIFTLGGLFSFLSEVVVSTTSSEVFGAVLLGLLLLVVEQVISLPISIYSTFVYRGKTRLQ
jgi:STE24 endopeptidase